MNGLTTGTVRVWNKETLANVVEARTIRPGDQVAVLAAAGGPVILGRLVSR